MLFRSVGGEVEDEGIAVDVCLAAEVGGAGGAVILDCAALDCCGAGEAAICAGQREGTGALFVEISGAIEFI